MSTLGHPTTSSFVLFYLFFGKSAAFRIYVFKLLKQSADMSGRRVVIQSAARGSPDHRLGRKNASRERNNKRIVIVNSPGKVSRKASGLAKG